MILEVGTALCLVFACTGDQLLGFSGALVAATNGCNIAATNGWSFIEGTDSEAT